MEVDRRVGNNRLNNRAAVEVFEVVSPQEGKLVRLRQIDVNHYNQSASGHTNALVLSAWEVFGDLIE
jgi:hypothetical protein